MTSYLISTVKLSAEQYSASDSKNGTGSETLFTTYRDTNPDFFQVAVGHSNKFNFKFLNLYVSR